MGFFDIFRQKKTPESERVNLSALDLWLQKQRADIKPKQKDFLDLVRNRVSIFIKELEERKSVLETINLNEKKAEEKIKLVVKENLYYYTINIKRLIENLRELEEEEEERYGEGVEKFIEKVNSLLYNFEKKSYMNFEKATFLIGKELESVKIAINDFFKDLKRMIEENKNISESHKIISSLEVHHSKIKEIEETEKEILENIKKNEGRISDSEKNIKNLEKKLAGIRKSKEYSEERENEKSYEERKNKLKKELLKLREAIDFKALNSFFHSDDRKMKKLKEHYNNLEESIDNPETLFGLMKEAELEIEDIERKIKDFSKMKNEFLKIKPEELKILENNLRELENEIKRIKMEIISIEEEKSREAKKQERFKEVKTGLIDSIKDELKKMNVELYY